eukprot:TRINITY_DN70075_c0_g1_i1.p1 TRINITY_DN70075_c0_g1~~TRINITY_DN70075_c0_g1_i1.p1  ORF type:complete len:102 (+),score=18.60 TRINITY_DN70075_c0_g1_i1:26-331(+)
MTTPVRMICYFMQNESLLRETKIKVYPSNISDSQSHCLFEGPRSGKKAVTLRLIVATSFAKMPFCADRVLGCRFPIPSKERAFYIPGSVSPWGNLLAPMRT